MELIHSGIGTNILHLRQNVRSVVQLVGKPEGKTSSGKLRTYFLYPSKGLECIISEKSGNVLSIFFYPTSADWLITSTDRGIAFGMSRRKVIERYGQPNSSGGGFKLMDDDFVGAWVGYDLGIGFHFDRDDRVAIISVFAPKRVAVRHS